MVASPPGLTLPDLKSAIIREPLVVLPNTTVMDAITQMSALRLLCHATPAMEDQLEDFHRSTQSSCVLVVQDKAVVGILTERDIVLLSAQQHPLERLEVQQVMKSPVVTLQESALTNLFFVISQLQQHQIRHLPILNEQKHLVGMVTHESLQQNTQSINLLRLRLVSEVMTRKVVCAAPTSSMLVIAQLMAEHRVSSVIIVKPGGNVTPPLPIPVGILTERDLVQFQALGLDWTSYTAEAVMSAPVFAVRAQESLWAVQQVMKQRLIQRVVVSGEQGELLGIITQSHLLQAINPLELYRLAESLEAQVKQLEAEKLLLLENRTADLEQQVEARTATLRSRAEREKLLTDLATKIRSSLSLEAILNTTVAQIRQVLSCDRVTIWQFETNQQLTVVAESTDSPLSLMGMKVTDTCFQQNQAEQYRQGHVRVVPDIYTTEMAACHRKMLIRCQIRAKIIVPLLCGNQLWGILNATEGQKARDWLPEEVELLQALSVQLTIALQQATVHQQLQEELSERQQMAARLSESEQRYAVLVEASPVGIFRTDAKGNCTYVNDRWSEITGLAPEMAYADGWVQALHADDVDRVAAEWSQAIEKNRPFRLEYRFHRSDGTMTWVYGQSVAERDASGKVISHVGTITDINGRKLAEQQLNQLNQELEAKVVERTQELSAFKLALDQSAIVAITDARGVITYANDRFCEISGYSRNELIGQTHRLVNSGYHPPSFFQNLWCTISSGHVWRGEICNRAKDSSFYWVASTLVPFLDSQGQPFQYLAIRFDITARKLAEAQLQQSNEELARATRLKDEFLANMSHELRTPLNAILGMTEGLEDGIFGDINQRQHKALQTIDRSASHLLELINDILDVAKIESGQIELDYAPTAVASLCQSSLAFIKQQALKKSIQLEIKLPSNLPDLFVDERRIRQVLINLLNNAVKFTPDRGRITVEVSHKKQTTALEQQIEGITRVRVHRTPLEDELGLGPQLFSPSDERGTVREYLRIAVIDTGIGIAPEHLRNLFQPFIQIDSALNRQYTGTGLGLALVKRIVELHGGEVGLTSRVGFGSCFTIDLPCLPSALASSEAKIQLDPISDFNSSEPQSSPLILLAEDNEANISTVSSYLVAKGYRLLLARNGEEAIALAKSADPDLVLMDIQMPGIDGLEAMQQIRRIPNLVNVPIIALTALAMSGDRERCLAAGASDYLTKPVKLKQLISSIQQFLKPKEI